MPSTRQSLLRSHGNLLAAALFPASTGCAGTLADNLLSWQATRVGKRVELFKKQPDGTWKVCADIWSPDAAPAPAVASGK